MSDLKIHGYASLFNERDLGGDCVAPHAFKESLIRRNASSIKMLWHHKVDQPVGMWDKMVEDERGLYVEGRLFADDHKDGGLCYRLVREGIVDGLSIGFKAVKSRQISSPIDTQRTRLLLEIDLWEVSIVTFPMLPQARLFPQGKLAIAA